MKNVLLSASTKKNLETDKFEGIVIFKSEEGKEISIKYTTTPVVVVTNSFMDISFVDNNEEFKIKGMFSKEIFSHLTKRQNNISLLSLCIIPTAIIKAVLSSQMESFSFINFFLFSDKYKESIEISATDSSIVSIDNKVYEEIFNV